MTPHEMCLYVYGHPPGPGVDILIHATDPVSQEWVLEGRTSAGRAIIEVMYPAGKIHGARWVAAFKGLLAGYGMTHDTIFPEVMERIHD